MEVGTRMREGVTWLTRGAYLWAGALTSGEWSGRGESNPHRELGKLEFYH